MKLSAIQDAIGKTVYAPTEFEGEQLTIVFYEGRLTPAFVSEMVQAEQADDVESLARAIGTVVAEWDLTDDDGNVLEPSFEVARTLPFKHLGGIMAAITTSLREDTEAEGKDSGSS